MMTNISFIHVADLHLDSPFTGLSSVPDHIFNEIQNSTFRALDRMVQYAIEKDVDFVLIVGDLFDNEKQSLKAQLRLKQAFETLQEHQISVYVSYGNHDFINGNIHPITYPSNVYVFPDETVRHVIHKKHGEDAAAIYGFSYENRAVTVNKTDAYTIQQSHIPFHIAMLHGSIANDTEHDKYAPFHLGDLVKESFDYWALGHIHKRQVLKNDPPIIYPGNIQGRNRKETGKKGCYYINMTKNNNDIQFLPLQEIEFYNHMIDISDVTEAGGLEARLMEEITNDQYTTSRLISITFTSNNPDILEWELQHYFSDMIEFINEQWMERKPWMYMYHYTLRLVDEHRIHEHDHFIGELDKIISDITLSKHVQELYGHREARKYLERLAVKEEREIRQAAKQLLLHELMKSGRG
ncbi:exonuclease SbcCD subunit D [Virgibacillus soli]